MFTSDFQTMHMSHTTSIKVSTA